MDISQWKSLGQYTEINGHNVFYIDIGNSTKTLVILHGFPSSSFDFHLVLHELSKKYRVIIHDHIGFGLSSKPIKFSYSLIEQTNIALALWNQLGVKDTHVLAHDYGTSIATELVARENENQLNIKIKSYCLCNGSMLIRMAKLLTIQKLLRSKILGKFVAQLTNKLIFKKNLNKIWHDKSKLLGEEIDQMWKLLTINNGKAVMSQISRYTLEREKFWDRWIGGLERSNNRFHIVWAENDPIAVIAMADELDKICKNSNLIKIPQSGHYPMIETPEKWLNAIFKNPF